jgi:hypothetical protein
LVWGTSFLNTGSQQRNVISIEKWVRKTEIIKNVHDAIAFCMINGDRLCGLVDTVPGYTTEMYCVSCEVRTDFICYVEESRPPLWSSGQNYWLEIQRSGFDSPRHHIIWKVPKLKNWSPRANHTDRATDACWRS